MIQPTLRIPIHMMPNFQPVSIGPMIVLQRIFLGATGLA